MTATTSGQERLSPVVHVIGAALVFGGLSLGGTLVALQCAGCGSETVEVISDKTPCETICEDLDLCNLIGDGPEDVFESGYMCRYLCREGTEGFRTCQKEAATAEDVCRERGRCCNVGWHYPCTCNDGTTGEQECQEGWSTLGWCVCDGEPS